MWTEPIDDFFFFGQTAFGDQYAYRRTGAAWEPIVYRLECIALGPDEWEPDFTDFIAHDFLRSAREPYDERILKAVGTHGSVDPSQIQAFAPPQALGGPDDIANIVSLPAATAMIYAGDIMR